MTGRINAKGRALIKEFEGLSLSAKPAIEGGWQIGYGHTDSLVHQNDRIGEHRADELLESDLIDAEKKANTWIFDDAKTKMTSNQFSAVVCFLYNVKIGQDPNKHPGVCTLINRINDLDFTGAADEFEKWNKYFDKKKQKYVALPGLTRRRLAEKKLFLTPDDVALA